MYKFIYKNKDGKTIYSNVPLKEEGLTLKAGVKTAEIKNQNDYGIKKLHNKRKGRKISQ